MGGRTRRIGWNFTTRAILRYVGDDENGACLLPFSAAQTLVLFALNHPNDEFERFVVACQSGKKYRYEEFNSSYGSLHPSLESWRNVDVFCK